MFKRSNFDRKLQFLGIRTELLNPREGVSPVWLQIDPSPLWIIHNKFFVVVYF